MGNDETEVLNGQPVVRHGRCGSVDAKKAVNEHSAWLWKLGTRASRVKQQPFSSAASHATHGGPCVACDAAALNGAALRSARVAVLTTSYHPRERVAAERRFHCALGTAARTHSACDPLPFPIPRTRTPAPAFLPAEKMMSLICRPSLSATAR